MAPKGTPPAIVEHYASLLKAALEDPAVIQAMASKGTSIIFKDPAAYRAYFAEIQASWEKVARKVGVYKRAD